MDDVAIMIDRLVSVLADKGILTEDERDYILGIGVYREEYPDE